MSFAESLSRWGASKLAEVSTYDPSDFDLNTVDVVFEYEKGWSHSEYTGGGGVASVTVTGNTKGGLPIRNVLESGDDVYWSLADVAGEISEFDAGWPEGT